MTKNTAYPSKHSGEKIVFISYRDLQFFDLKQMIEYEIRYRRAALQSIRTLKEWRADYDAQTDIVGLFYGSIEGIMLRRHAEESVRLYWTARTQAREAVAHYMKRLQNAVPWRRAA